MEERSWKGDDAVTNFILSIPEALQYGFIQRALAVGILLAICCSLLGTFLVLRKYSMIGDGLAHVSFATVAVALIFNASPLFVSIPVAVAASFVIERLTKKSNLEGDAAIALMSSATVSFGVLAASLGNGFNVDLFSYLFGSILVIGKWDLVLSCILSGVVILAILLNFNKLFSLTYDENFAKISGVNTGALNAVLLILTSVTVALGIRVVGTMLISSLLIFPSVSALQCSFGFKKTVLVSMVISVSCVVLGIFISYHGNLPTGASIVMLNLLVFIGIKMGRLWRGRHE